MERREILKGAAWLCLAGTAAGCKRERPRDGDAPSGVALPEVAWTPVLLTAAQALVVEHVAQRILPPDEDTPGAREAGVGEFIESVISDVYTDDRRTRFIAALEDLDQRCRNQHGKPFWECDASRQDGLLAALAGQNGTGEGQPAPFFVEIRELTIRGFCTSRVGATRFLAYAPIPGSYQPCIPLSQVGRAWATR